MGRTLVIILEGAATELIERWMKAGALPSLTSIAKSGTWGPFTSLPVPYEPPALLTAFTGTEPGEHGCFSYWHIHGTTCNAIPRIVMADDIPTPFLWQTDVAAKLRVAIVNLFGTHPPQPVNGHLISYPLSLTVQASHPPNLLRELLKNGIHYSHDACAFYTGSPRNEFVKLIESIENARINACLDLLKHNSDLSIFNITIIERLSHFWWYEVEPESGIDDNDTALWRAYHLADHFVAKILDELKPDDNLIVFSEMGFGPLKKYVSINDILAQAGLLVMEEMQIDPSRTLAMEAVQGSQGINLNLKRRYSDGVIDEAEEEKRREEVREVLLSAINSETGLPLFKDVVQGRDLYPGKRALQAPDLIVIPYDERYLPLGHRYWAQKVNRHLQTGWHRRNTFWAGIGPKFACQMSGVEGFCGDIAHTITDCLGLPTPSCHGSSLTRATKYSYRITI